MLEIKDYIRDRVDDQITWYDKKSQTAQKHWVCETFSVK